MGGLQLAGRVRGGDRYIDAGALQGRLGIGQIGFRLGHRDLVVAGVDADQYVARLHVLLVVGEIRAGGELLV